MARTLTITRKKNFQGSAGKWMVKLDGYEVARINNGETQSIQIDKHPHQIEIIILSAFGKPTLGIDPGTALIMAGGANCNVMLSLGIGFVKNHINVECSYDCHSITEVDFIDAVTQFMVNVFNRDAILERLNDPNNRRNDLRIACRKDGVHIQWDVSETTMGKNWSTGYDEEAIPYEAAGVTMPEERLTKELLTRLESSVKNAILEQTRFVKNEYGCFALGTNKKSSLY